MIKILLIEDDVKTQKLIKTVLPEEYLISACSMGRRGLALLRENPDLVLLDIGLPDMDGFLVLEKILDRPEPPAVIIATCCGDIPRVVRALKMGACNYLLKPYGVSELLDAIRGAVREKHLRTECRKSQGTVTPVLNKLIGSSDSIAYIRSVILRYAERPSPILITGESGTGKDLTARIIHELSNRRKNPFLALNCSALPPSLIETELFGSETGAFTGAVSKPGHIEYSDGGTLFLDEIGDMALTSQCKLLRFIEEQVITRVGGVRRIGVDVRILAATNKDLEAMMRNRQFRTDLYYRLNILPINIPPLRERKEDIPLMIKHFLEEGCYEGSGLTPEALDKLLHHQWPGNVRELKSVLERAAVHAEHGAIERRHIMF